ncbi:bifunctional diguanylate cyclase/phosphodiesterase [Salinivibrio sp. ES.052]|uniref:putative bifunctional diguanylate cyclase/phosphodiesterase n=1 Tax=Salinivibrio sp. ES.052 TaxID=1882823 RepID=UPI0009268B44|nr:bifunctional diguanylate cyclase/phosphodiesterase [Salinivibrio sp. ES.052]SIO37800.1 diguanylate cyclase/phosphodiesterase [Salinivibrio sp. ES.052]
MKKTNYYALKLAFIYFFFATLWILFSDRVVTALTTNLELYELAQAFKGHLFVVVTSIMLWRLARKNNLDLERASDIDSVTGLHSPSVFMRHVDTLLARAAQKTSHVLVIVDIDGFTSLTNKLGFERTNHLLSDMAHAIEVSTLLDKLTSRIHADRFACLAELDGASDMALYIERLHRECSRYLQRYDQQATCSIGVALFGPDGDDAATLMTAATRALNDAKKRKGAVTYHDIHLTEQAQKRRQLITALRQAIKNKEIEVVFQPQYRLASGELTGLEVLARWTHETYGAVPPSMFIPLAEEQGFCEDLTALVLEKSAKQLHDSDLLGTVIQRVSVNISAVEFNSESAIRRIDDYLQLNPEFARYLCLEITETAALDDILECARVVDTLKRHGVTFSIDDFGVGYTSLGLFNQINVDEIKIDRSFIQAMESDSRAKAITAGIIDIAKRLEINVVAEGVETVTQLALLKSFDCEYVQGYYLGYPASLSELKVAMSV